MRLGIISKYLRFIYDMMAQTVIVICILNIFFGTIVDTFSGYYKLNYYYFKYIFKFFIYIKKALRSDNIQIELDKKNVCFICNFTRE
jgi:hypothetical protein